MGFELPWALLGLGAAAAPVLVHLMRRRDLPKASLPTLLLLERAQAQSQRRMRLVDLLLLILRVLALAVLAVAASRPYVEVALAWGDGSVVSATLVLDDSMSMMRDGGGDSLYARAKKRAIKTIGALPPGSEVAVVAAGAPARTLVSRTRELGAAQRRIEALPEDTARGTALPAAITLAERELTGARHPTRRLLVLSDFARHADLDRIEWPGSVARIELERIGPEAGRAPNRAITEAIAAPDPSRKGGALVRVTVRGYDGPDESVPVRLVRDGQTLAEEKVSIAKGAGHAVLRGQLVTEGDPTAELVLRAEDDLSTDDRRGVLLRPPPAARVLLVNGDPHASRHEDEVSFLSKAFDAVPADAGRIAYRTIDPDTLMAEPLSDEDLVVLAGAPAPSPPVARRLRRFVEQGGGLLVAPARRADPRAVAAALGDVLPARPEAAQDAGEKPWVGLETASSSGEHRWDEGLRSVTTRRRWRLDAAGGGRVALQFADGSPALVIGSAERGKTAVLAVTLDDDWSDLPLRPGFVPLVVQLARSLAPGSVRSTGVVRPGSQVSLALPPGASRARVITPSGATHDLTDFDAPPVPFDETDEPGAYRVQVAAEGAELEDDVRAAFVVAPPRTESHLSAASLPSLGAGDDDETTMEAATVRRPVAPWLLLGLGLLVLAEAVVRTRAKT